MIPAYNEESRIGPAMAALRDYLEAAKIDAEIIVVDDGSRDDTAAVAMASGIPGLAVLKNKRNRGKGYTVRRGLAAARGECVLFMDADGPISLEAVNRFMDVMRQGYDMVISSRYLPASVLPVPQGPYRRFASTAFRLYTSMLFWLPFSDTQCGFKMFSRRALGLILPHAREDGFIFDVELLHLAKRAGLRIGEEPVTWTDHAGSKVGLFNGPIKMALDLMRLRLRTALR
ncbi:MAG: glycosyltransferase family 2 protein [Proteobacteria bacterium]|nr:glycosyltransferase family 2 protein [Pseudomonadota bacterium]